MSGRGNHVLIVALCLVTLIRSAAPQTVPRSIPLQGAAAPDGPSEAQRELRIGSSLTRQGSLTEAIPHLLAAQRAGADPYATSVDLGICYLGTNQYRQAIAVLLPLRAPGAHGATVENLLAQSYLGTGDTRAAFDAFLKAAAVTPGDEKLYAYMADACTDHRDYALGLQIVNRGLATLPRSPRLHYERAVFLSRLGRFEEGKPDFEKAVQLAPGGYIGYLARVQEDLYEDNLRAATEVLHQAIRTGHRDYRILSLLGTVLLHEGAAPGEPQFAEARAALEESARDRPDYSATQIALGKIDLMLGRDREAAEHLEIGRRLEPDNPAVYPPLAEAWEHLGDRGKAREMREQLRRLLAEKASAPDPSQP